GVNRRADEQNQGDADDAECPCTVAIAGRQGRKKDLALVSRLHCRLRQTGIERAIGPSIACTLSDPSKRPIQPIYPGRYHAFDRLVAALATDVADDPVSCGIDTRIAGG